MGDSRRITRRVTRKYGRVSVTLQTNGCVNASDSLAVFVQEGHTWSARLAEGGWIELRLGQYTLDHWHAMEWSGEREIFVKLDGPLLFVSSAADGPWTLSGIDASAPRGALALERVCRAGSRETRPSSITVRNLKNPELLAAVRRARPCALKVERAIGKGALDRLGSLRYLNLEGSGFDDSRMLEDLASLRVLDLSYCEALRDIGGLEKLENLHALYLGYCQFIEDMSALQALPRLAVLGLNGCAWLRNISGLEKLKQLRLLCVYGCRSLPEAQIDALQEALPRCQVLRGHPELLKDSPQMSVGRSFVKPDAEFLAEGI